MMFLCRKIPKLMYGQGYATEAATAIIDYLFSEVKAEKILISYADKNPASGRVAQKCGMRDIGTSKNAFTTSEGETVDIIEYEKTMC